MAKGSRFGQGQRQGSRRWPAVVLATVLAGSAGLTSLWAQGANPQPPAPVPAGGRGAAAGPQAPGGGRGRGPGNLGADWTERQPIQARSPEEQAGTFILPTGYRMELVASDPDIVSPSAIEFDGNGRMYVVEMRTYMLDADGRDKYASVSRISRWESTRGDGVYDKHTVFVDNLVLPRMVLPLDNDSILTNETDTDDVVKYTDTNGDGVSDKRELFYTGVGRTGNLEHQQSGFVWGMDNWIYSTYNAFRFRWTPTGILREPTGPNGGQWGLTQDADGKMWFVDAGGERGPMNFQVPIHYGSFNVPDQFEPGFDVVWPAPGIGDMQGGMNRIRMPVANLNHFTATTGPEIVSGHRLPEDLQGDLLFTEPVGRLIRRAKIVKTDGLIQLQNAYPGTEFILGSDPLFRPVNIKTAPDGTVYIVDMYHGIIQESQWTPPGSYLRAKIEQYELDKIIAHGRIWRLRYDGYPAGGPNTPASPAIEPDFTRPRMLGETPAELLTHLSHPNAWWRNSAQRLLVLKQDKSVVPALTGLVRSGDGGNLYARFHALWTLEGLDALEPALVREVMKDANPRMRIQAVRASETLYKAGDKSFETEYRALLRDADTDVAIQAMLTLNILKVPGATSAIRELAEASAVRGVKEIGTQIVNRATTSFTAGGGGGGGGGRGRGGPTFEPAEVERLVRGQSVYNELCFACHGEDGRGTPLAGAAPGVTRAPTLEGSARVTGHRDYVIKVLLHGLTGPIDGQTFTEVMIPMGSNTDQWIADVGSFIRNSFGNTASLISAEDVARVRAATSARTTSWTSADLTATVPALLSVEPTWTATASHGAETAARALSGQQGGWSSGGPQAAGMWFQIELPEAVRLAEVQLDVAMGGGRGGFGGRGGRGGRGAAQAAPVAPPTPGFPRGYQLQVSTNGTSWTEVATGQGSAPTTVIPIQPVQARFVRITQTAAGAADAPAWSIQRARLYSVGR